MVFFYISNGTHVAYAQTIQNWCSAPETKPTIPRHISIDIWFDWIHIYVIFSYFTTFFHFNKFMLAPQWCRAHTTHRTWRWSMCNQWPELFIFPFRYWYDYNLCIHQRFTLILVYWYYSFSGSSCCCCFFSILPSKQQQYVADENIQFNQQIIKQMLNLLKCKLRTFSDRCLMKIISEKKECAASKWIRWRGKKFKFCPILINIQMWSLEFFSTFYLKRLNSWTGFISKRKHIRNLGAIN